MLLLTNPVRDYAWGSQRRLAWFLGRAPSDGPEAELWIGAHEGAPSRLADGRTLDRAIAADPATMLGEEVVRAHGARLPFLMKVLAVDQPLSLQVHPGSAQAREGFEREERDGIPLDAPERSFKDVWHKPELIYALTRFEGMAGFREPARTVELLGLLACPWSLRTAEALAAGEPEQALSSVVEELLATPPAEVARVVEELLAATRARVGVLHRQLQVPSTARARRPDLGDVRREAVRVFELFPSIAHRYPDDPGVLVTLLLNHLVLAPGEAMYLGAGVVHAYVAGLGVEIMAASDNVLRAGLTAKHRDPRRLLEATRFAPVAPPRWAPEEQEGVLVFSPPVAEFALRVARAPAVLPAGRGPAIALALEDSELLEEGAACPQALPRGAAVFVPPTSVPTRIVSGEIAWGSVPGT